jgi:pantothenate kinase type III
MSPQVLAGAVDIGNSRIKMIAGGEFFVCELRAQWQDAMHTYLWAFSGKNVFFGVSSVNPEALALLETELKKRSNVRWRLLQEVMREQSANGESLVDTSGVQGIGTDRVLGLVGALQYVTEHYSALVAPIITIDCGTAITVNAMTTRRTCIGGAIMPGMHTQFQALRNFTQLLPEVEAAYEDVALGTNTAQAMRVGIVHGLSGAVKEITANIIQREFAGENPVVFLTGGDAPLMMRALEGWQVQLVHQAHLVLHGASALMGHWMQKFVIDIPEQPSLAQGSPQLVQDSGLGQLSGTVL